jgi:DNA-binding transcriptional MerR regulator/methylmalonyl-CoA mutase cobalamin-binding subunit
MTGHLDLQAGRHPIGVVAERTGLSPDLLRVWERRYRAVEPSRAPDGQRLYSDSDVERLRLLRLATLAGRSIRQVAQVATEELVQLVREDEAARQRAARWVDGALPPSVGEDVERALELARAVDAPGLESMLRRTAAAVGVPIFLEAVVAPLLRRMGEEWQAGRLAVAQEHLATAIIQRVLEGMIHFLVAPHGAPNLLVATLSGEQHKMGALLAATAAAAEGWRVTYLGPDLPADEIANAAVAAAARVVGVSIVHVAEPARVLTELRTARTRLPPSVPLLAGGAGAVALAPDFDGSGIHAIGDLSELRAALRKNRTGWPNDRRDRSRNEIGLRPTESPIR